VLEEPSAPVSTLKLAVIEEASILVTKGELAKMVAASMSNAAEPEALMVVASAAAMVAVLADVLETMFSVSMAAMVTTLAAPVTLDNVIVAESEEPVTALAKKPNVVAPPVDEVSLKYNAVAVEAMLLMVEAATVVPVL